MANASTSNLDVDVVEGPIHSYSIDNLGLNGLNSDNNLIIESESANNSLNLTFEINYDSRTQNHGLDLEHDIEGLTTENESYDWLVRDTQHDSPDAKINYSYYGLEAINRVCTNLYPSVNSFISSPAVKLWDGGSQPLDYIKVYKHDEGVTQPHWHFITLGLSDLYGDSRVHSFRGRHELSGYGFELTFRLRALPEESEPPRWPAVLLNNLARYVFNTDIIFREFDHIPWHGPLDCDLPGGDINKRGQLYPGRSEMRNMLVLEDPELPSLDTPHGQMTFLQVVGIMEKEFIFARSWKSRAVIDKLLDHPQVGPLLVTDMHRNMSIFDLDSNMLQDFQNRMLEEGTNLGRVTAHMRWRVPKNEIRGQEPLGVLHDELDAVNDEDDCDDKLEDVPYFAAETATVIFEPGAAELLPIMVQGRLMHGSSFTFCSPGCHNNNNIQAVQFIPSQESGHFATKANPMIVGGGLLQVYCTSDFIRDMDQSFSSLESITKNKERLPLQFSFENPSLTVRIDMLQREYAELEKISSTEESTVQNSSHHSSE